MAARVDDVLPGVEGLGVPAGPAPVHPSDRRRHRRHRGGRGELRRHHVRQGRLGPQAAGRLRRPGQLPGGRAAYFAEHAWGNATLADLLDALGRRPAGTWPRGPSLAGDRRGEHAARRVPDRRRRHVHRVRGAAGGGGFAPGAAAAPDRGRPVRPRDGRPGPAAPGRARHQRRADRRARAGRASAARSGAGQRRRPDLRQDQARRALAGGR